MEWLIVVFCGSSMSCRHNTLEKALLGVGQTKNFLKTSVISRCQVTQNVVGSNLGGHSRFFVTQWNLEAEWRPEKSVKVAIDMETA